MTSGMKARRCALLALLALIPAISCAALELDGLLARLARPAPATTAFVEARFSRLLDEPIVVKGELQYEAGGVLARTVSSPFHERTEIRDETVRVEREGKPPRQFSLKRSPELRSMLGSFAAVLGGNRESLEQDFNLNLDGDEHAWRLELAPKAARVRRYVKSILMEGRQNEPRCIIVTEPDREASFMLVGAAAAADLPKPLEREWLESFCASGGA
jgi:Outer membrane lipoprotein carrier protein LolA-like